LITNGPLPSASSRVREAPENGSRGIVLIVEPQWIFPASNGPTTWLAHCASAHSPALPEQCGPLHSQPAPHSHHSGFADKSGVMPVSRWNLSTKLIEVSAEILSLYVQRFSSAASTRAACVLLQRGRGFDPVRCYDHASEAEWRRSTSTASLLQSSIAARIVQFTGERPRSTSARNRFCCSAR